MVFSWTTQDSKVPRIGLQCRRFPPIRPKPGQKRRGSARTWWAGNWPVCFVEWSWWWTGPDTHRGQVLVTVDGHYQAILWLGAPALRPQLGQV